MGKGRPRAVEKGVLGQSSSVLSSSGSIDIPPGPVFYPTEDEFKDPLEYIYKIRPEAEPYGICRIVPPKNWKPPFALDLDAFTFPTKTQAIHQLQARPPSCDSETFELEYNRFLEDHFGRKSTKKRVVFDGKELDLCKLFNGVKRFGGYDKVVKDKKWGEVFRFVRTGKKISECSKHVLCQLYREHLFDYESYYNQLNRGMEKSCKRGMQGDKKSEDGTECRGSKRGLQGDKKTEDGTESRGSKRRRRNSAGDRVEVCKIEKEEERDQICEQCNSGLHGEVMLLCDRCNKGWHIYCLSPPLKRVPHGNWYCLECLNSDKDSFGFVPGKHFSMEAFRRMADRAKKKWFGSSSSSRVQMEKKFWEIVEGSLGEVEVRYGSDLDTSVYGSGFPRLNDQRPQSVEADTWDEYCASPWNLNNLPKLEGSMLRAVHDSIAGVMVPWLYIGMLFSSFCWHFEDHCFYSMNYLHWGEPKCWYSVPGSEANAFEKVMRNSLPDLFDAQPDLLFQLVTMLNPSVLQENGVPVYSVLQEPGNFVITFPRSFHGGFNFGLNCAEAVNFAPADWLPHGGIGAELYQFYHKAAVLSHEELLCVIAKSNCDHKVSPYLKKELLRTYTKEKTWRERLWRVGVVNSSPMSPRKHPEYVGTEEDPTCIICQQYLYLSAVFCRCRPSAFVCLEHWEHLCECKPSRRRLLYRHTLAELNDLVRITDEYDCEETPRNRSLRRQLPSCDESSVLMKKVKGGHVTFAQLAEEWLLRSCKIFQNPYSSDAYTNALKEAEQFVWAGSEMEPVRDVVKNLIEAQNWADGIRDCLSKVENWSRRSCNYVQKVCLEQVNNLLNCNPVPCNEPGHLKLKIFVEEARVLTQELATTSSSVSISELEVLYSRGRDLPICLNEIEKLGQKISSAKVWMDSVRKCISEKYPATIEIDFLYKLKSEMLELQVQVPESEMLLELLRKADSCKVRCGEILKGPINIKNVQVFLQEWDSFTISIPELELLRRYHSDAVSWISRFNGILVNIHEREDQENVVRELNCILKDGALLRIPVDEFPLVEVELKRACCREKALMARGTKVSVDFIQQILTEALGLQIEKEKFFVDISGVLSAAMHWEERARHILASESQMSEFEDALRTAKDIHVVLPSLDDVKDAVSMAHSWLKNSEPFLASAFNAAPASSSVLQVETLKALVSQSKILKISMEEPMMLQTVLRNCVEWEHDACSLLHDAECTFNTNDIGNGVTNSLILKIESLVTSIESVIKAGLSLGFDFNEILTLQEACSSLQWCKKALSFCSVAPPLEEVESLMEVEDRIPVIWASGALCSSLIDGVGWLGKAAKVVPLSVNHKSCKLSDVEDILSDFQRLRVPFPVMANQLFNAIEKHKLWQEKVHLFFSLKLGERSWSQLLQLKELGKNDAFSCSELDRVQFEVGEVEKWLRHCEDIVVPSAGDMNPLFEALLKVKRTLDRSMYIYDMSMGDKVTDLCMWCSGGSVDQEFLTCSICSECYHLRCLGPIQADENDAMLHICPYCQFVSSGSVSCSGGSHLRSKGKRPDLDLFVALLSESEDFVVWMEEKDILRQIVEQAVSCKTCLTEVVDYTLAYCDKDLSVISRKLTIALKAVKFAGIFDHEGNCNLDRALVRNAWRVRSNKLLEGSQKPLIQQVQRHLKEGVAISMPPEDYYWKELTELKHIGLQWADTAKKVAVDSGALQLDKVFELILEGEKLPILFEKELKLLRARSMLYCICRKPYDRRAMIACDQCDEWYHFDCIKLSSPPKTYICPACKPEAEELSTSISLNQERSIGTKFGEPQTPSPRHTEPIRKKKKHKLAPKQKTTPETIDNDSILRYSSGISRLWWRNRKPFRRAAKKRSELESLSPFFHIQKQI